VICSSEERDAVSQFEKDKEIHFGLFSFLFQTN